VSNKIISNEEIKDTLESLKKIKQHCSYADCKHCVFCLIDEPCMFFSTPWQWELGELEENL
jgi:putative ribosome biogenesis GTPase RsgA